MNDEVIALPVLDTNYPIKTVEGASHSCVLFTEGNVKCWGRNNFGEVGNGLIGEGDGFQVNSPVKVNGITDAKDISAGTYHTCALLKSNKVICWGAAGSGRLGFTPPVTNPVTTAIPSPLQSQYVNGLSGSIPLKAIYSGGDFNCVLLEDGSEIKCWGLNGSGGAAASGLGGWLGIGSSTADTDTATTVTALDNVLLGRKIVDLAAGNRHICAILSNSGSVYCWGNNNYAQLGVGTVTTPTVISLPTGSTPTVLNGATAISTKLFHTCAVVSDHVQCWGKNANAQSGAPVSATVNSPLEIRKSDVDSPTSEYLNIDNVKVGSAHSCATTKTGEITCWGSSTSGKLGIGDGVVQRHNASPPIALSQTVSSQFMGSGEIHNCAYFGPAKGFYCWGDNTWGQLGIGVDNTLNPPIPPAQASVPTKVF